MPTVPSIPPLTATIAPAASRSPTHTKYVDGVFNQGNPELANMYKEYKRVLAIVDHNVFGMYVEKMTEYFNSHGVKPTLHRAVVSEDSKARIICCSTAST